MVVPTGHPSFAVTESDRPAHARETDSFSLLVSVRIDANELLVAIVECPERGAVPADRVGRVTQPPTPRARVVGMHAVGCTALGAQHVGIGDRDRGHDLAGRALDLGDGAVAHVGDERPRAAKRDGPGRLPHLDARDHGPVRRFRSWGGGLRLSAGAKDSDGERRCKQPSPCNSLSILDLLHSLRTCLLLTPEIGPRLRVLISSTAAGTITWVRARLTIDYRNRVFGGRS